MENDKWKDALLCEAEISQLEFHTLPEEHKIFILDNRHIFYNVNGGTILNLLHPKYKAMSKMLRITDRGMKLNPGSYKRLTPVDNTPKD